MPKKLDRSPTFTLDDDITIVWEVSAAKAHLAPFGDVLKRFATAAERANKNQNLKNKVTTKRLQDRFKKLMDVFEKKDASERMMSGISGQIGEVEDLLGSILEAQKDLQK
eukprot:IDg17460t1